MAEDDDELEQLRKMFRKHCEDFGNVYSAETGVRPEGSSILRALTDVMADIVIQAPEPMRVKLWARLTLALAISIDLSAEEMLEEMEIATHELTGPELDS